MFNMLRERLQTTDAYISLALGLAVVLLAGALVVNYTNSIKKRGGSLPPGAVEMALDKQDSELKTHTIKPGETLWSIAELYYKSGINWVDIAQANKLTNPEIIHIDNSLIIPHLSRVESIGEIASGVSTEMSASPLKSYTVARGDSLWTIAEKAYQNGYRWMDIMKANNLANPNMIFANNILILP